MAKGAGSVVSGVIHILKKLYGHTEVQENSGCDSSLDSESSVGLKSANLLLGLLRGGDCTILAWLNVLVVLLNVHPPNILYVYQIENKGPGRGAGVAGSLMN